MSVRTRPVGDLLFALIGPMVWAAHFFVVYLLEAMLCVPGASDSGAARIAAAFATVIALVVLICARLSRRTDCVDGLSQSFSFTRPLIYLSMVAVLWTSLPLLVVQTCQPAGS